MSSIKKNPAKRKIAPPVEHVEQPTERATVKKQRGKDTAVSTKKTATVTLPVSKPSKSSKTAKKTPEAKPEPKQTFETLKIHANTLKYLKENNITELNALQEKILSHLVRGRDIATISGPKTGKTSTAIISALQLIARTNFKLRNGTACVIMSPTREAAIQTYNLVKKLSTYHNITYATILSNTNKSLETQRLNKGITVVVCTPSRFLEHIQEKNVFWNKNIQTLIIDDADQHCELEHQPIIQQIVSLLPPLRHTVLLSETNTLEVRKLAKKAMNNPALVIMPSSSSSSSTGVTTDPEMVASQTTPTQEITIPEHIEQGALIAPADKKFSILYTFLQRYQLSHKTLVLFSTSDQLKYFSSLLGYIDIVTLQINDTMDEDQRTKTYYEFSNASSSILLCTSVAIKGLKIPFVDFVFHYDCPVNLGTYARSLARIQPNIAKPSARTKSIVLLLEENEADFLTFMQQSPYNATTTHDIVEYDVPSRLANRQRELIEMVASNFFLHRLSRAAYVSYMRHYAQFKQVDTEKEKKSQRDPHLFPYDTTKMDIMAICRSYAFEQPPKIKE